MGIKTMKLPISFGGATKSCNDNFFKTLNSIYFDPDTVEAQEDKENDEDEMESIVRSAHMESRLFFDPSTDKSMIRSVEEEEDSHLDCVAMALESADPYEDFKASMEEMSAVIAKNRDWGRLEELLAWYLSVNQRHNHAYIIAAFVDLLLNLSNDGNEGLSSSISGSSSMRSSSCVSGELLQQLPKSSSSASCFSSSSPSNSSLSHEQEKVS